jgi:metacaspase-1
MCFKKKPSPVVPASKRALLFGINKYGGGNDLQGCINDIDDVGKKLNKEFPDFIVVKYKDSQVTCSTFYNAIKDAISVLRTGDVLYLHYSGHGTQIPSHQEINGYHEALYLFDGPFIDDQIQSLQALTPDGAMVIAKFDSCFSGDLLRELNPRYKKNRFYPMPGVEVRKKVVTRFARHKKTILKWVVFSGCSEEQTSADAYFNGRFNGAFTYFDNLSYDSKSIYTEELKELHKYLPSSEYEQNPTLDGDITLFNKQVLT